MDKPKYNVNIDFDYASKMWRKNKIHISEGYFKYIKIHTHKYYTRSKNKNHL